MTPPERAADHPPTQTYREGRRFKPLSSVTSRSLADLWEPYVPEGTFGMLEGDPGLGKSLLLQQAAADLSRGLRPGPAPRAVGPAPPSWLPVRAWADNFAAVRLEGLYAPVEAAGAQPLADYIYAVKHKGAGRIPWLVWGSSEGVDCEQCEEGLAIRRAGHTSAEQVGADWPGGVNRALDYSGATQLSSVPASPPEPAVALGEESGDLFDMEGLQQNNARKDSNA